MKKIAASVLIAGLAVLGTSGVANAGTGRAVVGISGGSGSGTSTGNTVTSTVTKTKTGPVISDSAKVQNNKVSVKQVNVATGDNTGAATPGHVQTNGSVTVSITNAAQ